VGLFQIFIIFKNDEFLLEKNYTGKNYTSSSSFSKIMANGKILAVIETLVLCGRPNLVVSTVYVM
jgi:hypothetical protein